MAALAGAPTAERTPAQRVLHALDTHAMPEMIAASAGLSLLQTLRALQHLEQQGLVERRGKECWGKR